MITLTAEIICDTCAHVVATGQPAPNIGDNSHWIWSACYAAEEKARNHGAKVTVTTVTCKECLEKSRNKQVADWEQSVTHNPPKRVTDFTS